MLSSVLQQVSAEECREACVQTATESSLLIEDFESDWETEWFSYRPEEWGRSTHKLYDNHWKAPTAAVLSMGVRSQEANVLIVRIDDYVAEVPLTRGDGWQSVRLSDQDFRDYGGTRRLGWEGVRRLTLSARERIRPPRGVSGGPSEVGSVWRGSSPEFRDLRWVPVAE